MSGLEARIIIVDDEETSCTLLARRLRPLGYDVTTATSASAAMGLLAHREFDLVLLDVIMPVTGGMELLAEVRQQYGATELPIIMLTAMNESEGMVEALERGANDYVTKPIDFPALAARLQTHLRLKRTHDALSLAYESMHESIAAAMRLQRAMLPTTLPELPELELAWAYRPCVNLAADTLDIIELAPGLLALYHLDVTGHGVRAALLSSGFGRALASATHHWGSQDPATPAAIARQLNDRFPLEPTTGDFFTLLYGILDVPRRTFRYVAAGHPPPVLARDGQARVLDTSGPAIGLARNTSYVEHCVELSSGDRLFLVSDAMDGVTNAHGEEFGSSRLLTTASESGDQPLQIAIDGLVTAAAAWCIGQPDDDLSVIGIEAR